ncbi:MAG: 16S rRNA (uracil(1498)-N(3))-methyltransferase [Leptospiraceae bacterium]|nr:16S rRNA (uracil(1498)-N(3))-methyltransferase [Leptospiraceae bacterium]MDW7975305.1 16S rRNA (uracil(1498)-N(3))-methyltransferase [Leptospiraceae bacterium]
MILYRREIRSPWIQLEPKEKSHLRSLRLKEGDTLWVSDGNSHAYKGILRNDGLVEVDLQTPFEESKEQNVAIFSALPSGNRLDKMLDMATQLGMSQFFPVIYQRSERKDWNKERMERIVMQAGSQSQRWSLPKLHPIIPFSELERYTSSFHYVFYLDVNPHANLTLTDLLNYVQNISLEEMALIVGPEGGFSEKEKQYLEKHFLGFRLAPNVLRIETAVLSALSVFFVLRELIKK